MKNVKKNIGPNTGINQNDLQIIKVNLGLSTKYNETFGTNFEFLLQHEWTTLIGPTPPDNTIQVEEEMTFKFLNHNAKCWYRF